MEGRKAKYTIEWTTTKRVQAGLLAATERYFNMSLVDFLGGVRRWREGREGGRGTWSKEGNLIQRKKDRRWRRKGARLSIPLT
jgi:hypothetical protein